MPDADNPSTRAFVVRAIQPLPDRVRIMVGEIPHHLRASLDLLVCQLLLKKGVTDPKLLERCAFPILTKPDLSTAKGRLDHDRALKAKIDGIDPRAYELIVALQPCATNGPQSHLALLQELDNTDKHRLLIAAAASAEISGFKFRDAQGNLTTVPHDMFVRLEPDTLDSWRGS